MWSDHARVQFYGLRRILVASVDGRIWPILLNSDSRPCHDLQLGWHASVGFPDEFAVELLHVITGLHATLEVIEVIVTSYLLNLFLQGGRDLPFNQIRFVAKKHLWGVFRCAIVDICDPTRHYIQRLFVGEVEHDYCAVNAPEELRNDLAKPLLAGGIPELNCPVVLVDELGAFSKFNADRGHGGTKLSLHKTEDHCCLTDFRIPDQYELHFPVDHC